MNNVQILNDIIRSRRSIFPPMYTGDKIEDDVVLSILENAIWAPNHRHTEPWRFVVMKQEQIPQLCSYGARWYKEYTPKETFSELKYNKIQSKALSASHIIAICMKRDPEKRVPKWEEKAAVACAVQNMWLTVTALGLGSYWSTPAYALQGASFFNLEEGEKCMGLFYLGVPKEDIQLAGKRDELKTKMRWFE